MKRIIVIAFCILLLALPACKRHETPPVDEETTTSVETTTPAIETTVPPVVETPAPTGVYTPTPGTEEYDSIVQGASDYLRISGDLTVVQLKAEDGTAIMDVEVPPALAGWRTLLALVRNGDTWVVTFSADAFDGTPEFKAAWFPGMSAALLGSLQWTRARTTLEDLARTHAIAEAASLGSFARADLSAGALKLARTPAHEWWASCVVAHKTASVDAITVYMRWRPDGGGWETFDCGTGIEPTDDPRFPSDVADIL